MGKSRGSGGRYRSAISGRYVTSAYGHSSSRTTVRESTSRGGSSGPHYRSAISGRYVTSAHGQRSPNTTVREN